jgi:antitoxin Phd
MTSLTSQLDLAMTARRIRPSSRAKRQPPAGAASTLAPAWQLQAAKAKFSEVFRRARADGPQFVTRGGTDAVVVIPVEQYERLLARSHQPKSLVEFFRNSPFAGLDLKIERDGDVGRDVEL